MAKADNTNLVIEALYKAGITNPYSIAGILSIIQKESGFIPQSEISYSNTSNTRIREIFSKTNTLTDTQLNQLKASPKNFFDFVYGGRYGNAANEGYLYRGRGFNQLTFKDNYSKYGKAIGLDIVKNPDLVNTPAVAARIVAAYMNGAFASNPAIVKQRYGASNINDFKDLPTAVQAFYNANAGFAKDTSKLTTAGKTEALNKSKSLYESAIDLLKSPAGKKSLGILGASVLFFLGYKIFGK